MCRTSVCLLSALILVAGCSGEENPDARIPLTPTPDAAATVDARSVAIADAPSAQPDAGTPRPDAATPRPDAAAPVDAPLEMPDAAELPDAPVETPDAAAETPDAAESPDAPPAPPVAGLIINEVAPAITGGHDLVELLVISDGTTRDIKLQQNYVTPDNLALLPDVQVKAGDIIVVHLNPTAAMAETTAIDECPHTTAGCEENYDTAWDFVGIGTKDIGYSYRVLVVRGPADEVIDAVPYMRYSFTGTKPGAYEADLPQLISDGHWSETCAQPCDYATGLDNMKAASVQWDDVGNTSSGATVQRKANGVDDDKISDWEQPVGTTNSLGLPNL